MSDPFGFGFCLCDFVNTFGSGWSSSYRVKVNVTEDVLWKEDANLLYITTWDSLGIISS